MRMRTGLAKSKNMVSIRMLQAIGPQYAQDYITRFGFDADKHPPYLTMALGAGSVTPWQMARGYAVFANGGYRIEPYVVQRIVDDRGNILAQAQPAMAGDESLRVIDARNAFVMDSMMHDVVRYGTAARAMSLGRQGPGGQDRHHQRLRRCLVRRLPAHPGRHRLDRLRPAAQARHERNREPGGAAHLDQLHGQGAEEHPRILHARARRRNHRPRQRGRAACA